MSASYEQLQDDLIELKAELRDVLAALKKAKETIRLWHSMGQTKEVEDEIWELYQSSPEMQVINRALKKK